MRSLRVGLWFGALLTFTWVLTGCAARAGGGETATARTGDLVVDLPSLVIDYDKDGQPATNGMPLSELGEMIPPAVLAQTVFAVKHHRDIDVSRDPAPAV